MKKSKIMASIVKLCFCSLIALISAQLYPDPLNLQSPSTFTTNNLSNIFKPGNGRLEEVFRWKQLGFEGLQPSNG